MFPDAYVYLWTILVNYSMFVFERLPLVFVGIKETGVIFGGGIMMLYSEQTTCFAHAMCCD